MLTTLPTVIAVRRIFWDFSELKIDLKSELSNSYHYRCIKVRIGVASWLCEIDAPYLLSYFCLGMYGYHEILKNLISSYSHLCWNANKLVYGRAAIYISRTETIQSS